MQRLFFRPHHPCQEQAFSEAAMMHSIRCRNCNEQLLESTRIHEGEMQDTLAVPPGVMLDERTGRHYKDCPHCGARNGFHLAMGFNGAKTLRQGELLPRERVQ